MGLDLAAASSAAWLLGGVVLASGRHRARVPSPMLDSAVRSDAFTAPVVSALLNYASSISTTFLLPFALIQGAA